MRYLLLIIAACLFTGCEKTETKTVEVETMYEKTSLIPFVSKVPESLGPGEPMTIRVSVVNAGTLLSEPQQLTVTLTRENTQVVKTHTLTEIPPGGIRYFDFEDTVSVPTDYHIRMVINVGVDELHIGTNHQEFTTYLNPTVESNI